MEIEAKFAADEPTLQRLATTDALGGFMLGETRRLEHRDTYLDTEDTALAKAGYACRRREGDRGIAVQIKQLADAAEGIHRRQELEVLLEEDASPAQWPQGTARDLVLRLIGDAELQPLVVLRQTRLLRPVLDSRRTVAELSLDTVQIEADGGALPPSYEVEAELRDDGDEGDLKRLAAVLRDEFGLRPEHRSKLERALETIHGGALLNGTERETLLPLAAHDDRRGRRARALLALDEGVTQAEVGSRIGVTSRTVRRWLRTYREAGLEALLAEPEEEATAGVGAVREGASESALPPGIEIDDTMATAAVKTLRFHFRRMLAHEAGTRRGEDPEELHVMRVATRRMRAALRVFEGHLDAEAVAPLTKGLRRTGRSLGAVRDLDVFYEKTQRYLDGLPEDEQDALAPLLRVWREERDAARARMLAYLDGREYRRFVERFEEFLAHPETAEPPPLTADGSVVPHRVADVLPSVLYGRMAAVWAYAGPLSEPEPPLVRFHRLRIAGKFLRYTLEFFSEVLGPQGRALIKTTKALQDHLGDLQDAVVSCDVLRTYLTWGTWSPAGQQATPHVVVAPGVAAYLAWRQQELRRLIDTFPVVWEKIDGPEFGRELALVAARCRWREQTDRS